MSALPPEADIRQRIEHVCFVPLADIRLISSNRAWIPVPPPASDEGAAGGSYPSGRLNLSGLGNRHPVAWP